MVPHLSWLPSFFCVETPLSSLPLFSVSVWLSDSAFRHMFFFPLALLNPLCICLFPFRFKDLNLPFLVSRHFYFTSTSLSYLPVFLLFVSTYFLYSLIIAFFLPFFLSYLVTFSYLARRKVLGLRTPWPDICHAMLTYFLGSRKVKGKVWNGPPRK